MSPLTINCFGLVNPTGIMISATVDNDANLMEWRHMLLHAYVYAEGAAGCGGNNVASLLIESFMTLGY
jgi:alkylhydroperoxidase/carboxymuconolactone decarboxylase family protein YurZ